ncbi:MAG: hypothetical protein GXO48_03800 [Chlorobi bacterium]|nr:hypothetical protein [Chlorobiota bacterium]
MNNGWNTIHWGSSEWYEADLFIYIQPELKAVWDFLIKNMFNYFPDKKILLISANDDFQGFLSLLGEVPMSGLCLCNDYPQDLFSSLHIDPFTNEALISFTGWKPEETPIYQSSNSYLFGVVIGYQKPYTNPETLRNWLERGNEAYRLGEIWDAFQKIEPALNDSHAHLINWERLTHNPIEVVSWDPFRINHLLWLSGLSNNIRICVMHNVLKYAAHDTPLFAQALWHFISGSFASIKESPFSEWVEERTIMFKGNTLSVVFKHSLRSGRWWAGTGKTFVSVLEEDYNLARNTGSLPERWISFIKRKSNSGAVNPE